MIFSKRPANYREFKLSDTFIEQFRNKQPHWGYGDLSYIVYKRTYARELPDGTTEEWWQTVRRITEGTYNIQKLHCTMWNLPWSNEKAQRSAQTFYKLIWEFKFLPPGRGLAHMGTDHVLERTSAYLLNCGFTSTQDIKVDFSAPFCWAMDMSMLGVGVGFDTEGAGTLTIQQPKTTNLPFIVEDSREGWVDALRCLLDAYVGKGALPDKFDVSKVRPKGSPLKTIGGTASGPEPLLEMLNSLRELYNSYIGKSVDSTLIVDTFNISGRCVVSGGVRRTAQIALGDPNDQTFASLKLDQEKLNAYRWASNNSIKAKLGMDYTIPAGRSAINGEPGYAWLENMQNYSRMIDPPDYKDYRALGGNPCLPESTYVLTDGGYKQIKDIKDNKDIILIVQNTRFKTKNGFFKTATNQPIYKLTTKEGYTLEATNNHEIKIPGGDFKQLIDLKPGDLIELDTSSSSFSKKQLQQHRDGHTFDFYTGWLAGLVLGDGYLVRNTITTAFAQVWGEDKEILGQVIKWATEANNIKVSKGTSHHYELRDMISYSFPLHTIRPPFNDFKQLQPNDLLTRSLPYTTGFLRGLFDADGSIQGSLAKGISVRLVQANREVLETVQLALTQFGIKSKIYDNRMPEGMRLLPDGRGGYKEYHCQSTDELVISRDSIVKFNKTIGFTENTSKQQLLDNLLERYIRGPYRDTDFATVKYVEDTGRTEDVYDCTIDDKYVHWFNANGILVHNCLEQTLENFEACCLVETFPAHHDTIEDFIKTLKYAYLYAKTVTLLPIHDQRTNAVQMRNRRIGLSQSGIVQAFNKFGRYEYLQGCDRAYKAIQAWDKTYSEWLCISRSIKTTSVKPSGTVSLVAGATPGKHYPICKGWYVRRVQFDTFSTYLKPLEDAGYNVIDHPTYPNTKLVEFPVKSELVDRSEADVNIWEQVKDAVDLQHYWADNQVSCTVKFRPEEANQIPRVLECFETQLKGISFLPLSEHGYTLPPYEEITEEQYNEMISKIKPLPVLDRTEHEAEDKFCDGEACLLPLPSIELQEEEQIRGRLIIHEQ